MYYIVQDLRCRNNLRGGLFMAIHPNRLGAVMRAYDLSIADTLAFYSEDHLTAVNFRAKRTVRVFDRLTPLPRQ